MKYSKLSLAIAVIVLTLTGNNALGQNNQNSTPNVSTIPDIQELNLEVSENSKEEFEDTNFEEPLENPENLLEDQNQNEIMQEMPKIEEPGMGPPQETEGVFEEIEFEDPQTITKDEQEQNQPTQLNPDIDESKVPVNQEPQKVTGEDHIKDSPQIVTSSTKKENEESEPKDITQKPKPDQQILNQEPNLENQVNQDQKPQEKSSSNQEIVEPSNQEDLTNPQSNQEKEIDKDSEEIAKEKKIELKSLMISNDDLESIKAALESFKNGYELAVIEEQKIENNTEKPKTEVKDNENSFLHLGSILYNSDKIWSVWINNKKITSSDNNPDEELYIKSIDRSKVNVVWKMSLSKWKILSKTNNDNLAPKINDKNQVVVDFILKPNQTFILKNQKIVEGKVHLE